MSMVWDGQLEGCLCSPSFANEEKVQEEEQFVSLAGNEDVNGCIPLILNYSKSHSAQRPFQEKGTVCWHLPSLSMEKAGQGDPLSHHSATCSSAVLVDESS